MAQPEPVLIGGGGIAGLATALALAKRSIPSRILEQRAQPSEAGAGIQIGPNGVRALTVLGVAPHLATHVSRPAEIVVRQGSDARVLARMPLGAWIEARHGAPYWVVHRRDLQAALLTCVKAERSIEMTTGFDPFPGTVYSLETLPAKVEWGEVAMISFFTIIITFSSTLAAAWWASRLDPVEALRYE